MNSGSQLSIIQHKLTTLDNKVNSLNLKLDKILHLLEKDISPNCSIMKNHVDFVETVYDNVKNPLGYICNTISQYSPNSNYTLEDYS